MGKLISILSVVLGAAAACFANSEKSSCPSASAAESAKAAVLAKKAADIWDAAWSRFYSPKTHIFYDYISSYEAGKGLSHLPLPSEIAENYPSPGGQGSGMEDGMILAGVMLGAIVDMYAVTGDVSLKARAEDVFKGIEIAESVYGHGYIPRSVCSFDGKSAFMSTSRDQVTHAVHGMWKYFRSPLADADVKARIAALASRIADRMIENVTPETGWDFLQPDGLACPLGHCKMWNVKPHEAARLPMIYAAAWEMTGRRAYLDAYRKFAKDAIEISATVPSGNPAWTELQMQCSLEVLAGVETDPVLKAKISATMKKLAGYASHKISRCLKNYETFDADMSMLGPDWRKVSEWNVRAGSYRFPRWGKYLKVWYLSREMGESGLVVLTAGKSCATPSDISALEYAMLNTDYFKSSSCGILYHLACYWLSRKEGVFPR